MPCELTCRGKGPILEVFKPKICSFLGREKNLCFSMGDVWQQRKKKHAALVLNHSLAAMFGAFDGSGFDENVEL